MKAPIEHDRCNIIGIKIDDKNILGLSQVISDLKSQGQ